MKIDDFKHILESRRHGSLSIEEQLFMILKGVLESRNITDEEAGQYLKLAITFAIPITDDEIKDGSETVRYFANLLKAYETTISEKLFLVEMCDVHTETTIRAGKYEDILSQVEEEASLAEKHSVRVTPIEEIDGYKIKVTK